ncbi:lipoyl synthase [Candidatus Omnitrophota bacterium]
MMLKIDSSRRLKRFPYWLRQSVRVDKNVTEIRELLRDSGINTVCQSAQCPNIYDCFSRRKCTFLILGSYCTRSCGFCAIKTEKRLPLPDKKELFDIRETIKRLGVRNAVITSVTRDDLEDGGAGHFADCIKILRESNSDLRIEILVPDFLGKRGCIDKVILAKPDIFSHNIETVPRLYNKVRAQADYKRSLEIIRYAGTQVTTKSGLMVGLGETRDEIRVSMEDLRKAGCEIITIGQYLRPGLNCLEVEEFLAPEEFTKFSRWAEEMGFKKYSCSPFTRSSYLE